jgi:hypothetical protein
MNFQKKWTTLRKTSEAELARQGADKLYKSCNSNLLCHYSKLLVMDSRSGRIKG